MVDIHSRKIIIGLVLMLLICGVSIFQLYNQLDSLKNSNNAKQEEKSRLVAQVGKLIDIPKDEEPVIYTVANPEALKSEPFFIGSQVGDKVLVYQFNKKVILFRSNLNKIVGVSSINVDNISGSNLKN